MSQEPRDLIGEQLPKGWSQTKRDEVADQISDVLYEAGLLLIDDIEMVGIPHTHVPIETVEAYGLTIGVDANGYATEITSPHGLEVLG